MADTYRTDWLDPTDPHGNRVAVSQHGTDLKAARAMARKMSKAVGSAYVIRSRPDGWGDVAQLAHYDGAASPHGWDS